LFFQALFAAVSVFPVVTAATALTGRSSGRLIGFAYVFSWGLQQMIDFDFHEVALGVPLLAFSVSALVRRRPGAAILWALPLAFVKEDQGFTVAAIAGLMMATAVFPSLLPARAVVSEGAEGAAPPSRPAADDYRYTSFWGGVSLLGWGLFWSIFAITVIIPHFNPLHEYRYWGGAGGPVAGRADRGAQPGAAVRLQRHQLLGNGVALQRHRDAGPVHRGGRGDRPLAARGVAPLRRRPAGLAFARRAARAAHGGPRPRRALPGPGPLRPYGGRPARRGDDGGDRGRARLPVPDQCPVARRDLHARRAHRRGRRGHGRRPRRGDRDDHARPARPPVGPHGHVLGRERRQPGHPVRRLRRRQQ